LYLTSLQNISNHNNLHHHLSQQHHHHHQQQQHQHLSHHSNHHPPPPTPHGYVTFTTQILDAVNLTPTSVYHSPGGGSSPSLLSLGSGGGGMIVAKEEPIEITSMSSPTTTSAPVVTAKRRRPAKPANKQFACDKCEFRTAARGNLNLHENSVHLKIKHPCDQCKYEATQVRQNDRNVIRYRFLPVFYAVVPFLIPVFEILNRHPTLFGYCGNMKYRYRCRCLPVLKLRKFMKFSLVD
jgi:hypothetical protein